MTSSSVMLEIAQLNPQIKNTPTNSSSLHDLGQSQKRISKIEITNKFIINEKNFTKYTTTINQSIESIYRTSNSLSS